MATEKTKKKVLVGMSGGVDSSVTACLLKEQGYDVVGIHLRFWTDPTIYSAEDIKQFPQNKCCTLEGLARTRQVAHKLGIPFYVLNFEDAFKRDVVDVFVDGYKSGITPNPCVECNRNVKFGLFLQKMKELGADYIATGHYARITEEIKNGETKYQLRMAKDRSKDQSYFLYTLTQEKLKHILFPIGEYTKPEVRELAKKFGIDEVNKQKESQNLCFFPESTHGPFLKRYLEKQHFEPGKIVTKDGEQIGTHNGLPLYTIGQRKGLGIGGIKGKEHLQGQPWYVIKLDTSTNSVIVGYEEDLYTSTFKTNTMTFIDPADTKTQPEPPTYDAKIRYRFFSQPAKLQVKDPESASVEFIKPQRAITPGQSVVFYDNDRVVGGGIIE